MYASNSNCVSEKIKDLVQCTKQKEKNKTIYFKMSECKV